MKFDVVVGNPPFSRIDDRRVNIYPEFYRIAVELADTVAMIMPRTDNVVMQQHNSRLRDTVYEIVDIPIKWQRIMGIRIRMWTVYHSVTRTERVSRSFAVDLAVNNDIDFCKGKTNLGSGIESSSVCSGEFSVKVIKGLTKSGTDVRWVRPADARGILPPGKYAVLLPICIQPTGWTHTDIIDTTDVALNVNVFYVLADTVEECRAILARVTSAEFVASAQSLHGNSGTMTIRALKSIKI